MVIIWVGCRRREGRRLTTQEKLMTSLVAWTESVPGRAEDGELSVATVSFDDLRATVRVTGRLSAATCCLLTSVLDTHTRAGRRFLRVDLTACAVTDRAVLEPLRSRHAALGEAGGLLVFDNPDDAAAELLRTGDLFVSTPR
jgi:anti-anti-sigma regulatory factor